MSLNFDAWDKLRKIIISNDKRKVSKEWNIKKLMDELESLKSELKTEQQYLQLAICNIHLINYYTIIRSDESVLHSYLSAARALSESILVEQEINKYNLELPIQIDVWGFYTKAQGICQKLKKPYLAALISVEMAKCIRDTNVQSIFLRDKALPGFQNSFVNFSETMKRIIELNVISNNWHKALYSTDELWMKYMKINHEENTMLNELKEVELVTMLILLKNKEERTGRHRLLAEIYGWQGNEITDSFEKRFKEISTLELKEFIEFRKMLFYLMSGNYDKAESMMIIDNDHDDEDHGECRGQFDNRHLQNYIEYNIQSLFTRFSLNVFEHVLESFYKED